ncbi:hypothetical protein LCGC14_0732160 [marine sediment metagenome]|uniref:Uncharacterized protein n=1 Tax=marine sediment metagenome TaxID=412755 RepID=A0A0F9Q9B3_9ZZZZ
MDEGNFNKIVIIVFLILIEIVLFYFIWIGYNTGYLIPLIFFLLGLIIVSPTSKFKPKDSNSYKD